MTQSELAKAKAERPCKAKALVSEKIGSLSESEKRFSVNNSTFAATIKNITIEVRYLW